MNTTILVCPCGRRLRGTGLKPGTRGRCPDCGRLIRMPGEPETEKSCTPAALEDEWNWTGIYGLEDPPQPREAACDQRSAEDEDDHANAAGYELEADEPPRSLAIVEETNFQDGEEAPSFLEAPPPATRKESGTDSVRHEPWFPPRFGYPFRAAEGGAMIAALGLAFWCLLTLVSEYCLAILADAEMLGTPSMGMLVVLISALPSLVMTPLVLIYGLQYLARVLVVSAEGEERPPRPSDRNLDGLFSGLSPWVLWVGLGLGPALVPLAVGVAAIEAGRPWLLAGLAIAGLPYALMALAMGFLHDDALAARPGAILRTGLRLSPSFAGLSLTIAATLSLVPASFAGAFALREDHFWLYVVASLACWFLTIGCAIVAMRTLGLYFGPRQRLLKWRRTRRRWGVDWSL